MHCRARQRSLISGALMVALILSTGCGDAQSSAAPGALAVIVGAHSNMMAPSILDTAETEIDTASALGSPATVIVDDGNPAASAPVSLKAANDNPLYQQDKVDQLKKSIDKARADKPEVNLLAALDLAARSVGDATGPKTIVVIDSGLQTAGALRFQDQDGALLNANPDEVVAALRRMQQLPNLAGMRVVFTGLGDTAPPQQPLPAPARTVLVTLWTKIVEAPVVRRRSSRLRCPAGRHSTDCRRSPPCRSQPKPSDRCRRSRCYETAPSGSCLIKRCSAIPIRPEPCWPTTRRRSSAVRRRCSPAPQRRTARLTTGCACRKSAPVPSAIFWSASGLRLITSVPAGWAATSPDTCPIETRKATSTQYRQHRTARSSSS